MSICIPYDIKPPVYAADFIVHHTTYHVLTLKKFLHKSYMVYKILYIVQIILKFKPVWGIDLGFIPKE